MCSYISQNVHQKYFFNQKSTRSENILSRVEDFANETKNNLKPPELNMLRGYRYISRNFSAGSLLGAPVATN